MPIIMAVCGLRGMQETLRKRKHCPGHVCLCDPWKNQYARRTAPSCAGDAVCPSRRQETQE